MKAIGELIVDALFYTVAVVYLLVVTARCIVTGERWEIGRGFYREGE